MNHARRWTQSSRKKWIVLALGLTACGQGAIKPTDRNTKSSVAGSSNDATAKPTMTVEDVVHGFELGEALPEQVSTDADRAAREKSLVPEDKLKPAGAVVGGVGFTLDTVAADQREVVDLRPYDTGIRDQGSEGTCTAFATVGVIENLIKRTYGQSIDISERHHWSTYADYSTTSSFRQAMAAPIVSEATWPYNGRKPASLAGLGIAKLNKFEPSSLTLEPIVASLRKGNPVVIGVGVLSSMMNPREGGIIQGGTALRGAGHAIAVTGAIIDSRVPGGGYFIIKNSWGTSWGDNGYGYVAFDYCQRTWCDADSVTDASLFSQGVVVPRPDSGNVPVPTPNPVDPNPTPTPVPSPAPAPAVEPVASDFNLVGHVTQTRRLIFGMSSYFLTVEAKPEVMQQIVSIQYAESGGSRYTVQNGAAADVPVSIENMASPDFKTRNRSAKTDDVVVTLRSGKAITLSGISVSL